MTISMQDDSMVSIAELKEFVKLSNGHGTQPARMYRSVRAGGRPACRLTSRRRAGRSALQTLLS